MGTSVTIPSIDRASLWNSLSAASNLANCFLFGHEGCVSLSSPIQSSSLDGKAEALRGRSVLVFTKNQLAAALALIELDGIARRLVLCPPDLPPQHLSFVAQTTDADAMVLDAGTQQTDLPGLERLVSSSPEIVSAASNRNSPVQTDWILLTSGTTGVPKLVLHTLASLTGAIQTRGASNDRVVWSTFYDIRRYGGLVIFLRAVLTGASMVFSSAEEAPADFLARVSSEGVTHISGTPSHWRRALMSSDAHLISPRYVRLSGEMVDQAIINQLRVCYPEARIAHAFASTEAGVAFDVNDELTGFPASWIQTNSAVNLKVEGGTLRIRSNRTADRYLGPDAPSLKDEDGFVDTRDIVELTGDRYHFAGRRDGVINIGGQKVYPEEIEAVINSHPQVLMSLVRTKKNPITGAIVVASVVLKSPAADEAISVSDLKEEILRVCRGSLVRHKVPALIHFVESLPVAATGKMIRNYA
jgi:acyl-coenzyme A synthetase/AMP-(fatty) acid ligase